MFLIKDLIKPVLPLSSPYHKIDLGPSINRHLISVVLRDPCYYSQLLNKHNPTIVDFNRLFRGKLNFKLSSLLKVIVFALFEILFLNHLIIFFYKFLFKRFQFRDFLIVTHHPKFVRQYLSMGFSSDNSYWLFLDNFSECSLLIGDNKAIVHLPRFVSPLPYGLNILEPIYTLLTRLDLVINCLRPSYIVCAEGDAPYHSLVSEISRCYKLSSVCIQWGIHSYPWKEIAFSDMLFTYFFTWGDYFSNDLRSNNPCTSFVTYGYPGYNKIHQFYRRNKSNKIVFLAQAIVGHQDLVSVECFVDLCINVSSLLPGFEIVYREHPSHQMPQYTSRILNESNVLIDSDNSLLSLLADSLMCVSITSSSLVEGILMDSIPLSFNMTNLAFAIPLSQLEIGYETSVYEEALAFILKVSSDTVTRDMYTDNIQKIKPYLFTTPSHDMPTFLANLGNNSHYVGI